MRGIPPWPVRILIGWPAATFESCLSASEASDGLILTMICPLVGAGAAAIWACIGPDWPINRNNKTPAARLEYLNFLEVAMTIDENDKGRLRTNNGMNALFSIPKGDSIGWIIV